MIIDAENLILGRLATIAAKKALLGEDIDIVNSEKAVIIGKKADILARYKMKRARGDTLHGPYFPRDPDMIVKRTIRGMMPYKQEKGRLAYKRIKCYKNIPEDLKSKNIETIDEAKLDTKHIRFMKIAELSKLLGSIKRP